MILYYIILYYIILYYITLYYLIYYYHYYEIESSGHNVAYDTKITRILGLGITHYNRNHKFQWLNLVAANQNTYLTTQSGLKHWQEQKNYRHL